MTDRPLTFSAPMVRALLDGRKVQDRRILKPQPPAPPPANCHPFHQPRHATPYLDAYCGERRTEQNPRGMSRDWHWWQVDDRPGHIACRAPCVPGDRLWVREAFITGFDIDDEFGRPVGDRKAWYRATDRGLTWYDPDTETTLDNPPWKSSTQMPRWASRLTLIVTDVRVQRVQSITEEDARAEGVCETAFWERAEHKVSAGAPWSVDRLAFADLWNSLHGPGAWDANPWVAALTFTTHHQNIDRMEPTNGN